jgi:hypothetical protein
MCLALFWDEVPILPLRGVKRDTGALVLRRVERGQEMDGRGLHFGAGFHGGGSTGSGKAGGEGKKRCDGAKYGCR